MAKSKPIEWPEAPTSDIYAPDTLAAIAQELVVDAGGGRLIDWRITIGGPRGTARLEVCIEGPHGAVVFTSRVL